MGGSTLITARSDERLTAARAEPCILVSAELLDLLDRFPADDARVERPEDGRILGSLLKVRDGDQLLIWRVKGDCCYGAHLIAEWPD